MQSIRHWIVIPAILVIGAASALAKNGRDFAGFYSLTNAAPEGDQVRVTLSLQLFNYSGVDLPQAAVTIRTGPPEAATLGTYSSIEQWRDGTDVTFAMHLSISRAEFERWTARNQPTVFIVTHDSQGREIERTAQVSRRPAIQLQANPAAQ